MLFSYVRRFGKYIPVCKNIALCVLLNIITQLQVQRVLKIKKRNILNCVKLYLKKFWERCFINTHLTIDLFTFNIDFISKLLYMIVTH